MRERTIRFLLSNDSERGIDPDWYHLSEPTIELEIKGKQVLGDHLNGGLRNVIIFVFMEHALESSERMVNDLKLDEDKDYTYWFTGTGHGLKLRLHQKMFEVELVTDPSLGPVSNDALILKPMRLGTVNPVEWVQAIVGLGQELIRRFKSYPDSPAVLKNQERRIRTLNSWLSSRP